MACLPRRRLNHRPTRATRVVWAVEVEGLTVETHRLIRMRTTTAKRELRHIRPHLAISSKQAAARLLQLAVLQRLPATTATVRMAFR